MVIANRSDYRRTRLGVVGAFGVMAIDASAIALVLAVGPRVVWPLAARDRAQLVVVAYRSGLV